MAYIIWKLVQKIIVIKMYKMHLILFLNNAMNNSKQKICMKKMNIYMVQMFINKNL